jgi:peptide/nickel transport system substrate-binding protein
MLPAVTFALWLSACSTPRPIEVVATVTSSPPTLAPATATPIPSPTPIPYRSELIIGLSQEPLTLHPLLADDDASFQILDALYEPYITSIDFAYQANPKGGLLADLPGVENGGVFIDDAGTPNEPIDDQIIMTFRMLSGPTWCDGAPVTAGDSVYAYELANDAASGVSDRAILDNIATYVALDDNTIEIKLQPGVFDPNAALYFWNPLPRHIWSQYSASGLQSAPEATTQPCGYGPYTIAGADDASAGWVTGDHITLVANPNYFRGAPRTPRLIFRFIPEARERVVALIAGEIDIVTSAGLQGADLPTYAAVQQQNLLRIVTTRSAAWEELVFNLYTPTTFDATQRSAAHPILSDVRVRQAIAYAIDRQALIDHLYAGRSAFLHEPLTYPNHPLYTSESQINLYYFDPDRAQALLQEAGWIDSDGDGIRECQGCTSGANQGARLALTYHTTSSALRDAMLSQIANDMNAIGFEITAELLPTEVFFGDITGLIVGDFEIGQLAALTDAHPESEQLFGCDWIPSPGNGWYGQNYSGWCNEAASTALFTARQSLRLNEQRAAYAIFQREYTRELPGLPLIPRLNVFLINPRVENFQPHDFMPSVTWNAYELAVLANP